MTTDTSISLQKRGLKIKEGCHLAVATVFVDCGQLTVSPACQAPSRTELPESFCLLCWWTLSLSAANKMTRYSCFENVLLVTTTLSDTLYLIVGLQWFLPLHFIPWK
ncbi:uncharacterized protein LOC113215063 [Frankliniella occidentalis]|uniref:Uncharacterized protein LOC113215063 n=1 Tax=Frankliniella occidentalis TaxID=133901 RepID=A0A9C6U361_FRAOC|nr:uncharacterized protein LOC113215063 [Frankliniella occidentalis]